MANILFVSKSVVPPWNDSSKNMVRDIANGLKRHQPVVLTDGGATGLAPQVEVEAVYRRGQLGRYTPSLWSNARVFGRLFVGKRHHVWHFFFAPNGRSAWAAEQAARRRDMPSVHTVCSAPADGADWQRVLFADYTVVLSRHTEQRLLSEGVPSDRLQRIPPAVAPLATPDPAVRGATRLAFGLPTDEPLLVYPGDLEFSRGAERSIELLADLPTTLGARLAMACRAKTARAAREERRLRERAHALGIAAAVHWVGETSDIHGLLGCADLVILPAESFYAKMDLPLALIEAMYLERAIIVGHDTPAAELGDGGGARVVDLERDALCEAARVLLEDSAQRVALGEAARHRAARAFSPPIVVDQYERLYDEIIDA